MAGYHRVYDYVAWRLTAKKAGLAPWSTLVVKPETTLLHQICKFGEQWQGQEFSFGDYSPGKRSPPWGSSGSKDKVPQKCNILHTAKMIKEMIKV